MYVCFFVWNIIVQIGGVKNHESYFSSDVSNQNKSKRLRILSDVYISNIDRIEKNSMDIIA